MQQQKTTEVCVGLEFGTFLNVQFEGIGSAKTSIIGIDRDKCLIIRPPAIAGIESKLFKKNQTVVSYLHEGMIFGFRCTLIGVIKTPFPLLILSYPEAAEQLNLRKHKRLSCLLSGQMVTEKGAFKIVILDISPSGCRFSIPRPVELGTAQVGTGSSIELTLDMTEEIQEIVTFTASVKNLHADGNGFMLGVEFNKATSQKDIHCLEKLKRYLEVVRDSINI